MIKKKRWKCYEYIFKKLMEYKFFEVCKFSIFIKYIFLQLNVNIYV